MHLQKNDRAPKLGEILLFLNSYNQPIPGIVVHVYDTTPFPPNQVDLCLFGREGTSYVRAVTPIHKAEIGTSAVWGQWMYQDGTYFSDYYRKE